MRLGAGRFRVEANVLSVAKLTVGQEAYCERQVAGDLYDNATTGSGRCGPQRESPPDTPSLQRVLHELRFQGYRLDRQVPTHFILDPRQGIEVVMLGYRQVRDHHFVRSAIRRVLRELREQRLGHRRERIERIGLEVEDARPRPEVRSGSQREPESREAAEYVFDFASAPRNVLRCICKRIEQCDVRGHTLSAVASALAPPGPHNRLGFQDCEDDCGFHGHATLRRVTKHETADLRRFHQSG
jgi:hypothetical protein